MAGSKVMNCNVNILEKCRTFTGSESLEEENCLKNKYQMNLYFVKPHLTFLDFSFML